MISRRFPLLAFVFFLAACTEVATDDDLMFRRYAGHDPWSIEGTRTGDRLEEVTRRLGPPDRSLATGGTTTHHWQASGQFEVIVDGEGRVVEVLGKVLKAGATSLVAPGMTPDQVKRVLGPGEFRTARSPSGFLIQLGPGKVTGGTARYANGDARFEISFGENGMRWVRASR